VQPFEGYLRERVTAWPELTGARLLREIREFGYRGGKTVLNDFLREVRPPPAPSFEVRFETPAGRQAQVDFAEFKVQFADDGGAQRKVWLFAMVLGHSRYLWAQFVLHQDLPTVLRCHMEAFEHFGGVPREILYDRMKTAVLGEPDGTSPSSTTPSCWDAVRTTASCHGLARRIELKPRGRSSDRIATSAPTSSWPGTSPTSRT